MTTKHAGHILIVDDNLDVLTATRLLLKKHYQLVVCCNEPKEVDGLILQHDIDLVLLDMNFRQDAISGQEGFYLLEQVNQRFPNVVIIMMTAYADIQLAVDSIKAGASNFIAKPWQNTAFLGVIAAAFKHVEVKQKVSQLSRKNRGLSQLMQQLPVPIIGESQAMQSVFDTVEKAAKTDANVLILGESGTGKELIARAIHLASLRANESFISLDMGAVSRGLFESELFGHKKGAFTDANSDRIGRFELADKGSLFLDELGNLPLSEQIKLLAALQNREITPVGASKTITIDIRLISATNSNLHDSVASGAFRQDLLYRLNTIEIVLPPLRERTDDIPLLLQYYLKFYNNKYKQRLVIRDDDVERLCQYAWPGNIRELAHSIERSVILSEGENLDTTSILRTNADSTHDTKKSISQIQQKAAFNLEEVESSTIESALKFHEGNISRTSKALGLTRGALYRRIDKYRLTQ